MKVLHFTSDGFAEFNSLRWRTNHLADALNPLGGHHIRVMPIRHWLDQTPIAKLLCTEADIIVIHRVMIEGSIEHALTWRARGKAVVVDWDDGYDHVEDTNPAHKFWREGTVQVRGHKTGAKYDQQLPFLPIEQFRYGLQKCTAGTVPSRVLVQDYIEEQNVYYLPNWIDERRYSLACNRRRRDGRIVIGWGGSLGHLQSFRNSGAAEALRTVLQTNPNVHLLIIGDDRVLKELPVPSAQIHHHPFVHYQKWPAVISMADIMIAPLAGEFDMRRSFLKAIESAAMQRPLVATGDKDYPVYQAFFDCPFQFYVPAGGSKQDRIRGWQSALQEIVDNFDMHTQCAIEEGPVWTEDFSVHNPANQAEATRIFKEIVSWV